MARLIKKTALGVKNVVEIEVEGGLYLSGDGVFNHNCKECKRLHLMGDGHTPRLWLLSEIGHGYHKRGEPNPKIGGLHPNCFTGDMRLHTGSGIYTLKEMHDLGTSVTVAVDSRVRNRRIGNNQFGKEIPGKVWLDRHAKGVRFLPATNVYDTGVQQCYRIELDSGHVLEVSEGHEMWIDDNNSGVKVRADQIKVGDKVPLLSGEGGFGTDSFPIQAELMGNLAGDGYINSKSCIAQWNFFGDDIAYGMELKAKARMLSASLSETMTVFPPDDKYSVPYATFNSPVLGRMFVNEYGFCKTPRRVPARLWKADRETVTAYLRGLYAADGHSEAGQNSVDVVLAQNDREFLREIQILLGNCGLVSRLYTHSEACIKTITYANGDSFDTKRKPCWRLHVGGLDQAKQFATIVGMGVPEKQRKLVERIGLAQGKSLLGSWRTARVVSVEPIGVKQTYCLTEPMTNTVTVNAIVTGNCRCTLCNVPPGYGFDAGGALEYKHPGYSAIDVQRKTLKAEPYEHHGDCCGHELSKAEDEEYFYHGTPNKFDTFEQKDGHVTTTFGEPEQVKRTGFFFTANPDFASGFAGDSGRVVKVKLHRSKTLDLTGYHGLVSGLQELQPHFSANGLPENFAERFMPGASRAHTWMMFDGEDGPKAAAAIKAAGYDSVKFEGRDENGDDQETHVVFDPKQIERVDNNGNGFRKDEGAVDFDRTLDQVQIRELKNRLASKDENDWNKWLDYKRPDGYVLRFRPHAQEGRLHTIWHYPEVTITKPNGVEIGHAMFCRRPDESTPLDEDGSVDKSKAPLAGFDVVVHPDHRRKGLASDAYALVEALTGQNIVPGDFQTKDGKAFVEGRKKRGESSVIESSVLGKSELTDAALPSRMEEHALPTHLEAEGYRIHIGHGDDGVHAVIHRHGQIVGKLGLLDRRLHEDWTGGQPARAGLRDSALMALRGHNQASQEHDGWSAPLPDAEYRLHKAAPEMEPPKPPAPPAAVKPVVANGSHITTHHASYGEAAAAKPKGAANVNADKNLWVRHGDSPDNSNRTLMVQFSSDLLYSAPRSSADDYYDKLYQKREGYSRGDDFWEIPQWQAHMANSMPDADHYTIRDPEEAIKFFNASGYKNIAFSAMDVNREHIKDIASRTRSKLIVGGPTDLSFFKDLDNVKTYSSIKDMVEAQGMNYKPGYDYRHFGGVKTIPRLTLSDGCRHRCSFCVVPHVMEEKPREEILQQADAFAKNLDFDLVYLNDKTYGQAANHTMLPELYNRIKTQNPNFKGFVVQTTAAQMRRFTPEFLNRAGIKHVELGIESVNDPILRANRKPATEALIEEAAGKLRDAKVSLIPNIMIGLPGENKETYSKTLDFLNRHQDIISHVNAYNLALYNDSDLGREMGDTGNASDRDENAADKSWYDDPQIHRGFSDALFRFASDALDRVPFGDGLQKGFKHGAAALAVGASLLMPAASIKPSTPDPMHGIELLNPQSVMPEPERPQKWTPEGLHPELHPIAQLESSFGKFTEHVQHSKGEYHTAYGAVGLKAITAHEEYLRSSDLRQRYPGLDDPEAFTEAIKKDHRLYNEVATKHWNRIRKTLGSAEKAAYGWRWGVKAAKSAEPEEVRTDPYVQKFKALLARGTATSKSESFVEEPLEKALPPMSSGEFTKEVLLPFGWSEPAPSGSGHHSSKHATTGMMWKGFSQTDLVGKMEPQRLNYFLAQIGLGYAQVGNQIRFGYKPGTVHAEGYKKLGVPSIDDAKNGLLKERDFRRSFGADGNPLVVPGKDIPAEHYRLVNAIDYGVTDAEINSPNFLHQSKNATPDYIPVMDMGGGRLVATGNDALLHHAKTNGFTHVPVKIEG